MHSFPRSHGSYSFGRTAIYSVCLIHGNIEFFSLTTIRPGKRYQHQEVIHFNMYIELSFLTHQDFLFVLCPRLEKNALHIMYFVIIGSYWPGCHKNQLCPGDEEFYIISRDVHSNQCVIFSLFVLCLKLRNRNPSCTSENSGWKDKDWLSWYCLFYLCFSSHRIGSIYTPEKTVDIYLYRL